MSKRFLSLGLIACTVVFVLIALGTTKVENPVYAKIVSVERGDVRQVAAITGRINYRDEQIVYASGSGEVARVLAVEGQRLAGDEVILRVDHAQQAGAIQEYIPQAMAWLNENHLTQLNGVGQMAVRIGVPCTLREIYVQEGSVITAGVPVARVSSSQQEIRCVVSASDSSRIMEGMWAQLHSDTGEALCQAVVEAVGELEADPLTGLSSCTVILRPDSHIDLPEYASVDANVYLAGSDDVMSLPLEAITERDTVWWVNDGKCTEIPAEIVLNNEMLAWVNLPEGIMVAIGEFDEGQLVLSAAEDRE